MKTCRILSAFLAVLMLFGTLAALPVGAIPEIYEGTSSDEGAIIDYATSIEDYLEVTSEESPISTAKAKLDTMQFMLEEYGYQIWADRVTGEVAIVKVATGEMLFTNPWDLSTSKTNSMDEKKNLLSQIIINYTDNGTSKTINSCVEAAMRGQIKIKYIKGGIRVEYAIGRQNSRYLVPRLISKTAFEEKIVVPMREAINKEVKITITEKNTYRETEKPIKNYPNAAAKGLIEVGGTYNYYDLVRMENPEFDMAGPVDYELDHRTFQRFIVFYKLQDPNAEGLTDKQIETMKNDYPITKKMAVYVFDIKAKTTEILRAEKYIKTWVPDYTFEELDADHMETEYTGQTKAPALFKLALEYTLDTQGLSVRLPANGIRFDESLYQLDSITVLPFMGAGKSSNGGYNFFPDGSGALFDYEKLNNKSNTTLTAKVYGVDYAYHTITGKHQETVKYPVFGSVEHWKGLKTVTDYDYLITPEERDEYGNIITEAVYGTTMIETEEDRGFFAIIEEGDSMAEISTSHLNGSSEYSSMKMTFYPRPTDSYYMEGAISVGANKPFKVVSSRKYVGNYKIRYIMLTDEDLAEETGLYKYYECSWVGMAKAYRDYLEYTGVFKRLTDADVDANIPLYIETLGTVETVEKILSMPVNVMAPLTTFEDIKTMYSELSASIEAKMEEAAKENNKLAADKAAKEENEETRLEAESISDAGTITSEMAKNFSNINFKLTGYANGGIYATVPYHLNWEESVGGAAGFQDLVDTAREEGFGVFPDFDFAYINSTDIFDGVDQLQHAVKTIDNRYTSRREYDATYQTYVGYYELALSPAFFSRFVTKLSINYMKYNPSGISVSTLGTALNSDFDEEDPYNREDAMQFTMNSLRQLSLLKNEYGEDMKVMTSGGNAYTLQYVDYILDAPLDSSSYNTASNSVPFVGMVLHGYKQYAGTPINEEGNIASAILKAIESGSGIYFKLVYQNTDILKEYEQLSKNYSISYEDWKYNSDNAGNTNNIEDLYVELNNLLSDLQTKLIIDHEFLVANRVPDADEAEADKKAEEEAKALEEAAKQAAAAKELLRQAFELRKTPSVQSQVVAKALKAAAEYTIAATKASAKIDVNCVDEAYEALKLAEEAQVAADEALALATDEEKKNVKTILAVYDAMIEAIEEAEDKGVLATDVYDGNREKYEEAKETANERAKTAKAAYEATGGNSTTLAEALTAKSALNKAKAAYDKAKAAYDAAVAETKSELGTTSAENEAVKQTMKAMDEAKVKLDEATEEFESYGDSAVFAAAVEAMLKATEADDALMAFTDATLAYEKYQYAKEVASVNATIIAERLEYATTLKATYNELTPTLRENVLKLEAAYAAASIEADSSAEAVKLAKEAVAKLEAEYNATLNNPEATEAEIAKAAQFYNTAKKTLEKAESDLAAVNAELAKIEALLNDDKIVNVKVLVLGNDDVQNDYDAVVDNGSSVLEGISGTESNPNAGIIDDVQAIVDAKEEIKKAEAAYAEAEKIYKEMLLVDFDQLTDKEAAECRATRMRAAIVMSQSEAIIKAKTGTIENKTLLFNDRYVGIVAAYEKIVAAKLDLEALVKEADSIRATNADAQKTYENAVAALVEVNVIYENAKAAYDNLRALALKGELVDENYELVVPTGNTIEGESEEEEKTEVVTTSNKYTYDDGSVVAVTYGGKNGNDNEAYRTFILNYNPFEITVKYPGITGEITIGAYGYHIINH